LFGTPGWRWSYAAHRLEARARVDLRLRQHRGLGSEPLDDGAHERPDAGRSDQHRVFALAGGLLEAFTHQGDEFGEARGLHGELPVVAGPQATRVQIMLYSLILAPLGVVPYFIGLGGIAYAAVSAVMGAMFLYYAWNVWRTTEGPAADSACRKLFGFSILWLFALFAFILAEKLLGLSAFTAVIHG